MGRQMEERKARTRRRHTRKYGHIDGTPGKKEHIGEGERSIHKQVARGNMETHRAHGP